MFLDFAACRGLEPEQFKLLAAFAHHADPAGECRVLQVKLAAEMAISASTVCRWTAELMRRGCLVRTRIVGGTYRYKIPARFLATTAEKGASHCAFPELHPVKSGIAHAASADSGAPASAPARLELSSGSKEPSERELSLSQDEIPNGWEEAAAAERRLAGLGPVNLPCEWRKLIAYSEGARVTIWRWRGWALKARCDDRSKIADTEILPAESAIAECALPGDDRQQRQARDWVRRGFWLRDGSWGPAPDQAGCTLPVELVAWCRSKRQARVAA